MTVNTDAAAALAGCPLLADFSPTAIEALLPYFEVMEGGAGDRLYSQGDEGGGLYVIARGSVTARVRDVDGNDRVVGRLSAPDSFGELALLLRGQRLVSIEAATDVVLLEMSYDSFRRLKLKSPDVCLMVIMSIVRRFGHVLDESRDLLQRVLLRQLAGRDA
ncbi:MAG: cyclic nucleotide-binding domain-containing protein [Dehalococcoidia bacterium]|nr:cyclic nucleotide-binding domain-containing protein [Dehalococcoidia bacterium]MCB9506576.1 cyclic nucleotide-binding domain-containing protein [Myxococcales bacterium]